MSANDSSNENDLKLSASLADECGLDQSFRGGSATTQIFATIGQYLEREVAEQAQTKFGSSQHGDGQDLLFGQADGDLQKQLDLISASIDADAEMQNLSSSFGCLSIQPEIGLPQTEIKMDAALPNVRNSPLAATLRHLEDSFHKSFGSAHSFRNLMLNASMLNVSLQQSLGAMTGSLRGSAKQNLGGRINTSFEDGATGGIDLMATMGATFGRGSFDPLAKSIGGFGNGAAATMATSGSLKDIAVLASSLTNLVDAVKAQTAPSGSARTIGGGNSMGLGNTFGRTKNTSESRQQVTLQDFSNALREGVDPNELHAPPDLDEAITSDHPFSFDSSDSIEEFAQGFGTWFARQQRSSENKGKNANLAEDDYDHDLASSLTSTIMSLASLKPMIPVDEQLAAFEKRRIELGMDLSEAINAGLAEQTLGELVAAHKMAAMAAAPGSFTRPADLTRNEPTLQLPIPIQEPILNIMGTQGYTAGRGLSQDVSSADSTQRQVTEESVNSSSPLSKQSNAKHQIRPTLASNRERRSKATPESYQDTFEDSEQEYSQSYNPLGNKRRDAPHHITSSINTAGQTPTKDALDNFASPQELEAVRGQIRRERREVQQKRRERKKAPGCTCKRSRCLKRYCECFAQGKFCSPHCQCADDCCNTNTPENIVILEQHRESGRRRPGEGELSQAKILGGVAAAQTITCNCVKSNCQKNYCPCYQSGLQCVAGCKCIDCMNNKDESLTTVTATTVRKEVAVPVKSHPDHPNFKAGSQGSMWSSMGSSTDFSSSQGAFGDDGKQNEDDYENSEDYGDEEDDVNDGEYSSPQRGHAVHHQLHHYPDANDYEYDDDDFEE